MDEQQIKKLIKDEIETLFKSDKFVFARMIQILDGRNIQLGRTTGTQIGTAADQKISLYGETPVVQADAITKPSGGAVADGEARTAIDSIIDALKNIGITA